MVHLPIHLALEAKIARPILYQWMYPIERELYELKQLTPNLACPEGSIEKGYIAKECMTLCSRYFTNIETKFNRPKRNHDAGSQEHKSNLLIFSQLGRALGSGMTRDLHMDEWEQARLFVLKNCDAVQPF